MINNFSDLIHLIVGYIQQLLPILAGIALLVFFWGLAVFIKNSGDAKSHEQGRSFMIWGVIGLFILLSFMGILQLFYSDLGFHQPFGGLPTLPQ